MDIAPAQKQSVTEENSRIQKLLIVCENMQEQNQVMELVGKMDVIMRVVSTEQEALDELRCASFDCVILDVDFTKQDGFALLEKMKKQYEHLVIFIYAKMNITSEEEALLNKYAYKIIIKDEHAATRLKEEFSFYLDTKHVEIKKEADITIDEFSSKLLAGKNFLIV